MRIIRELNEIDWDAFVAIVANAYPGIKIITAADRQRYRQRLEMMAADPTTRMVGVVENGRLLGGMRLFDFTMTLHTASVLAGGVGGVAVDLAYKKQKVARDMIQFFLRHYRERGAAITVLYPFRPDFYRKMGFGYGTKMSQYRVKPVNLPKGARTHIAFLSALDKKAMQACYGRFAQKTHGMMSRPDFDWDAVFAEPGVQVVGYKRDGQIQAYLIFSFQPGPAGHFLNNEILVRELVYETQGALAELLAFLHTQADQIDCLIFNTQDEDFHFLLHDPRQDGNLMLPRVLYHQSNTQGVGLMYRVIDIPGLFVALADHDFGGQTFRLKLTLQDTFLPEYAGSWVIGFENGRARLLTHTDHDIAITLNVAEFSSLVMGSVSFRQLVAYSLASISDAAQVTAVDRLFHTAYKPVCMTTF